MDLCQLVQQENLQLYHIEHEKVIELCIKEAKGKIPVIAGTGSNSTVEAISLTKHAEKLEPMVH